MSAITFPHYTPQASDADRYGSLFVYDLTHALPPPTDGPVARVLRRDEAQRAQEAMEASGLYAAGEARARLERGRQVYTIEYDGLIAAYGWVAQSSEPIGDENLSFHPAPGDAYIYDCATRPRYRGRGFYPALLRQILVDLRATGLSLAWIGTAPGNRVSQRGIVRAGFTLVAYLDMRQSSQGTPTVHLYADPNGATTLLERAAASFNASPPLPL